MFHKESWQHELPSYLSLYSGPGPTWSSKQQRAGQKVWCYLCLSLIIFNIMSGCRCHFVIENVLHRLTRATMLLLEEPRNLKENDFQLVAVGQTGVRFLWPTLIHSWDIKRNYYSSLSTNIERDRGRDLRELNDVDRKQTDKGDHWIDWEEGRGEGRDGGVTLHFNIYLLQCSIQSNIATWLNCCLFCAAGLGGPLWPRP